MNRYQIRKARVSDAFQIATVHVKTWQYACKGLISDAYLENLSIDTRSETWGKMIQNEAEEFIFIGENEGVVKGWYTAGKSRDKDATEGTGELYGIYVLPEDIGKGLGSQLMEHALNSLRMKGYRRATLWVLTNNLNSRSWYESKGWEVEGTCKTDDRGEIQLHETRYKIIL